MGGMGNVLPIGCTIISLCRLSWLQERVPVVLLQSSIEKGSFLLIPFVVKLQFIKWIEKNVDIKTHENQFAYKDNLITFSQRFFFFSKSCLPQVFSPWLSNSRCLSNLLHPFWATKRVNPLWGLTPAKDPIFKAIGLTCIKDLGEWKYYRHFFENDLFREHSLRN